MASLVIKRSLNGRGTTITKEEQWAHLKYVTDMNAGGLSVYEQNRERELNEMRAGMKTEIGANMGTETGTETGTEFDLPNFVFDRKLTDELEEVKTKHAKDIIALVGRLDVMTKRIETLESEINKTKETEKLGFFGKIREYLCI